MSDGSQQGVDPERAIKTILGGEPSPSEEEEKSPEYWLKRLAEKDDCIDGYNAHAEVMAKYIVQAYSAKPELKQSPIESVYQKPIDWKNPVILVPDLSTELKKLYTDEQHPFRRALSAATGFTWGWAFNIARYALGLPPQPNPAIVEI
jgi:hypothetical protein